MGFEAKWLEEGRLMLVTADEQLDDAVAEQFNDTMLQYFEESDYVLVHAIFDLKSVKRFFSIKAMANFMFPKHQRMGWNLFVGLPNKVMVFLISIATQLFQVRARNFDTLEDAIEFIKKIDVTLSVIERADNP